MLPDQRMHVGEVLVPRRRGAGEPPPAGRHIRRVFERFRHPVSRRRRLWGGLRNRVGLRGIGFGRRQRRRCGRRYLLRLIRRLRLGRRRFGLGGFVSRRRVALGLVDLFGFGVAEILRGEAASRRGWSGFWLRQRRCRRHLRRLEDELHRDRLNLSRSRELPIDQQQQRQQVQYEGADRAPQPGPPTWFISLVFSFEGFG